MDFGDQHNFGKVVRRTGPDTLDKPRCVFWEYLLLSESPFRIALNDKFEERGIVSPFCAFPILKFNIRDDFFQSGDVGYFESSEVDFLSPDECSAVGAGLALLFFFGVVDQHIENLLFSRIEGKFYFAPIDIEALHNQISVLTQTHLVAESQADTNISGLLKIRPKILSSVKNRGKFIIGFLQAAEFLLENHDDIHKVWLNDDRAIRAPIRVVLRPTQQYLDIINDFSNNSNVIPPLTASELSQLKRADIPYFFRYLGSKQIYWLSGLDEVSLFEFSCTNGDFKLPSFRTLINSKISPVPESDHFLKYAILQLIQLIDIQKTSEIIQIDGMTLVYQATNIFFKFGDNVLVKCKRKDRS